jgi:plastocyanin
MSDVETRDRPPEVEPRHPRLPGWAYPLFAVLFGGAFVWSFSRILLVVSKKDAAVAALLMALNVLIWSALVAYGSRVRRRPATFPLIVLAALALIGAGVAANVIYGDRPPAEAATVGKPGGSKNTTISLSAQQQGGTFTFTKDKLDADQVPHNVVLFGGADATAPVLFRGELVQGGQSTTYAFTAPPAGTYFFHCDVHPQTMTGTMTVAAAPSGGTTEGPPQAIQEQAKGIAFATTSLRAIGTSVTIHFDNTDAGIPHNMAIFQGTDASGAVVFRGDLVTGPGAVDYHVDFPAPGTYFFHCDVHPTQMTGTITVSG